MPVSNDVLSKCKTIVMTIATSDRPNGVHTLKVIAPARFGPVVDPKLRDCYTHLLAISVTYGGTVRDSDPLVTRLFRDE